MKTSCFNDKKITEGQLIIIYLTNYASIIYMCGWIDKYIIYKYEILFMM